MIMARPTFLCTAALLAASAPFLTGCAPSGTAEAGAAALPPKQAETLDKQLAGKVAGKPETCLPSYRSNDVIRVSDNTLLYRSAGNLVYSNDLKGRSHDLAPDSQHMVTQQ